MKNYKYDSVSVPNLEQAADTMSELMKKGWRELQLFRHDSWGDCSCPEITGLRPLNEEEIKEQKKYAEKVKNETWVYFEDPAYYGLWAVKTPDMKFQETFHLYNKDEAKGLTELLNKYKVPKE